MYHISYTYEGEDQLEGPEGDGYMQWVGMLREYSNAGTGEGRQRIELPGGGGLKRARPKLGCSGIEEEEGGGGGGGGGGGEEEEEERIGSNYHWRRTGNFAGINIGWLNRVKN